MSLLDGKSLLQPGLFAGRSGSAAAAWDGGAVDRARQTPDIGRRREDICHCREAQPDSGGRFRIRSAADVCVSARHAAPQGSVCRQAGCHPRHGALGAA